MTSCPAQLSRAGCLFPHAKDLGPALSATHTRRFSTDPRCEPQAQKESRIFCFIVGAARKSYQALASCPLPSDNRACTGRPCWPRRAPSKLIWNVLKVLPAIAAALAGAVALVVAGAISRRRSRCPCSSRTSLGRARVVVGVGLGVVDGVPSSRTEGTRQPRRAAAAAEASVCCGHAWFRRGGSTASIQSMCLRFVSHARNMGSLQAQCRGNAVCSVGSGFSHGSGTVCCWNNGGSWRE